MDLEICKKRQCPALKNIGCTTYPAWMCRQLNQPDQVGEWLETVRSVKPGQCEEIRNVLTAKK